MLAFRDLTKVFISSKIFINSLCFNVNVKIKITRTLKTVAMKLKLRNILCINSDVKITMDALLYIIFVKVKSSNILTGQDLGHHPPEGAEAEKGKDLGHESAGQDHAVGNAGGRRETDVRADIENAGGRKETDVRADIELILSQIVLYWTGHC